MFQINENKTTSGKDYVLFQKRHPLFGTNNSLLDITAAGHLSAGEQVEDGIREVQEELGIPARFEDLLFLGIHYDIGIIKTEVNREFSYSYFLQNVWGLEQFQLQTEELAGLLKLEIQEGMALFAQEISEANAFFHDIDPAGNLQKAQSISIKLTDFVPRFPRYYLKIFVMAQRFFAGEKYLMV